MPFVNYDELVDLFVKEFYQFSENHPEYELTNYGLILENNGLRWDHESMRNADIDNMNEQGILALIMGAIRAERFCDGALLDFFTDGYIMKWLKGLKAIDNSNSRKSIEEIYFEIGGFFGGYTTYHFIFSNNSALLVTTPWLGEPIEKQYSPEETRYLIEAFEALHVEYWNYEYVDHYICDGTQWELGVKYKGQRGTVWVGSNAYPDNWEDFLSFFGIGYDDEDSE